MNNEIRIEPVVIEQDARIRRGRVTQEHGWIVSNNVTGKRMGFASDLFATREAAEAAIPRLVRQYQNVVQSNQEAATARTATHDEVSTDRSYRTVHSGLYGEGRQYRGQPGATQYDDGSGRFNVQIWDES